MLCHGAYVLQEPTTPGKGKAGSRGVVIAWKPEGGAYGALRRLMMKTSSIPLPLVTEVTAHI